MSRRAFTYVEMLVVIVITVLISAMVMPNLVGRKSAGDEWSFKTELRALSGQARIRAIDTGFVCALAFDKSAKKFEILEQLKTGEEQPFKTLEIPGPIETKKFASESSDTQGDNWRIAFYPDGGTAGGGVEFADGDENFSLLISPSDNSSKIIAGHLPDLSYEQWSAGGTSNGT